MEMWALPVLFMVVVDVAGGEMLGKFVFHGDSEHNHGKSALNILHHPESIHLAPNPGPIRSDEVASVLALSLGLSVPKDVQWAGLQVNNPFKLPKAALMVSIDGVPKEHVSDFRSTASYSVDNVGDVALVSDLYYVAPKYPLSAHVSRIMEGASRVVSISGDEDIAVSGHSNGELSETSVWSDLTKTWKAVTGDGEVRTTLSRSEVVQRVPSVLMSGFTYEEHDQTVRVNGNGLEFSFNLDDDVDFKLFSELVYISHQTEELASHGKSFARDGAPDLFLLSVSALKGIEKKYGATSQQMKGALMLIEKFVQKTVQRFVKLYNGNILAVGVAVSSDSSYLEEHADALKPLLKVLEDNKIMVHHSGSELHLVEQLESEAQMKLCETLQSSLGQSSKSIAFKCSHDLPAHTVHKRSLMQFVSGSVGESTEVTEDTVNLGSDYDDNFPIIFNIWFWLLVLLALSVYVTSIAMWNMDPGRDSIIYRLTQQKIKSE